MKTLFEKSGEYANRQFKKEEHLENKPNFHCTDLQEAYQYGANYVQEFIPIKRDNEGFISSQQQLDFHTCKPVILMSKDSDLEIAYDLENELSERYTHWRPVFFL